MAPADVQATMTREEMVKFLESWGFKCDDEDSLDELATAVAHNCNLENIDLAQLHRLREVLNVAFSQRVE